MGNYKHGELISRGGFDIVHGCQLRCIGCPNSIIKSKIKCVSVEDFNLCLKNIDVVRLHQLRLFNYGEPLLHPDLPGILSQIPKQSYEITQVEISTNGQHYDEKMLIEAFKTNVLTTFCVSCDGDGTPQDYEKLRPPAKWDKLMEFLIKTKEIRDKYSPNVKLLTRNICPKKKHRKRWKETLRPLGWESSFRDWGILPGVPIEGHPSGRKLLVPNKICWYMNTSDEYKFYVDYDGTVVPCCNHPRAFVLGNIKEETYNQILNGERRKQILHEMKTNRKNMPICGKCERS